MSDMIEPHGSVDLVVMLGDVGPSFAEQMLGNVREAVALDTVERGLASPYVRRVIVGTNRASLMDQLAGLPVQVLPDLPDIPFHFGQRLLEIVRDCRLGQVLYIGGGAGPLLTQENLD
jgi:hypothetical protein